MNSRFMKWSERPIANRARPFQARTAMRMTPKIFLASGIAAFVLGCGHPATEKECEEIVERVARLELEQAHAGTETVNSEVQLAKEARRPVARRGATLAELTR